MIECVLFDFDGTLVDSNFGDLIYFLSEKYNKKVDFKKVEEKFYRIRAESCGKKYKSLEKIISSSVGFDVKKKDILEYYKKVEVFPDVVKSFVLLKSRKVKIVIVSNSFEDAIRRKLCSVLKYIDLIVTPEKTRCYKPNKKPVELAVKLVGIKKDKCILIGDSYNDFVSSQQAGIIFHLINRKRIGKYGLPKILEKMKI